MLINIHALEPFDDTLFTEEEIETLQHVSLLFKSYGSVAISEFSHEEDGWKYTADRDIISYDYANTLKID